jgi:hypothetical protein
MKLRNLMWRVSCAGVSILSVTIMVAALTALSAMAADVSTDSPKIGSGITKAAEGFETPSTSYIVANPTSIFSDHSFFGTKVTGELKRGERVAALAKVKYDWLLSPRTALVSATSRFRFCRRPTSTSPELAAREVPVLT